MKFRSLIREDQFQEIDLPPGCTLHLANGQQIQPAEIPLYINRGEIIEMHQNGQRVGRIRLPDDKDQLSQNRANAMGRALEQAQREKFVNAVNWIDQAKERFWCAICGKNQSHPMFFSAWVGPEPECTPICYHAVCKRCGKQGESFQRRNDHDGMRRIADLTEQRLIARYPHIAANLPPGYRDRENEYPDHKKKDLR
jgi:hypothetical protein